MLNAEGVLSKYERYGNQECYEEDDALNGCLLLGVEGIIPLTLRRG